MISSLACSGPKIAKLIMVLAQHRLCATSEFHGTFSFCQPGSKKAEEKTAAGDRFWPFKHIYLSLMKFDEFGIFKTVIKMPQLVLEHNSIR